MKKSEIRKAIENLNQNETLKIPGLEPVDCFEFVNSPDPDSKNFTRIISENTDISVEMFQLTENDFLLRTVEDEIDGDWERGVSDFVVEFLADKIYDAVRKLDDLED